MYALHPFFLILLLVVEQIVARRANGPMSLRKRDPQPPAGLGAPHQAYVALSGDVAIALNDKTITESQLEDKLTTAWYEACESILNPTQVDGIVWGWDKSSVNNDKTKQEGKPYVYVLDALCWQLAPTPDPSKPDQLGKAVADYTDATITYLGWTKQSAEAQSPQTAAAVQQHLKGGGGGAKGKGSSDPFNAPSGYKLQVIYVPLTVKNIIYEYEHHSSVDDIETTLRSDWQSDCSNFIATNAGSQEGMNVYAPLKIDKAASDKLRKDKSKPYFIWVCNAGCFQSTGSYPNLGALRQDLTSTLIAAEAYTEQNALKQAPNVEGDFEYYLKYNNTQAPPATSSEKHHEEDGSVSYNLPGFPTKRVYLAMLDDDIVKVQEGTETMTYNVERQRAGWVNSCKYFVGQTGMDGYYYMYLQFNKQATDDIKLPKWPYFIIAADGNCFLTEANYPNPGKILKDLTDQVTNDLGYTHDHAFSFISDMEKAYSAYANKTKNGNANLPPPLSTKGNSTSSKTPPAPSSSTKGKGGGKTPSTSSGKNGKGPKKTTK